MLPIRHVTDPSCYRSVPVQRLKAIGQLDHCISIHVFFFELFDSKWESNLLTPDCNEFNEQSLDSL